MFKIFVIVFLASGGPPVGTAKGKTVYTTIEACQSALASEDASDPKSLAAYKAYAALQVGAEVRLSATCAEVTEDDAVVDESQLPSAEPK